MRSPRTPVAPALTILVLGLLAGCGRTEGGAPSGAAAPARDLNLVASPTAEAAQVSALEARRAAPPARLPTSQPETAQPVAAPEAPEVSVVTEPAATVEAAPAPEAAAPAPEPPVEDVVVVVGRGVEPSYSAPSFADLAPSSGRRPAILIRGGAGGIHDDCKLDRPGAFGGAPTAINRSIPPLRGSIGIAMTRPRSGIR